VKEDTNMTPSEQDKLLHKLLHPSNFTRSQLEHTDIFLTTHPKGRCDGEYCTVHNRSDHSMRKFPQLWRGDRGFMERTCTHGIGHPDPDEISSISKVHGCDGCCAPMTKGDIMKTAQQEIVHDMGALQERTEIVEFLLSEKGRDIVLGLWKDDVTVFDAITQAITERDKQTGENNGK